MFKDFCYFSYMQDENHELDTDLMHGLVGKWFENAKAYYETDKYKYFIYEFKDSPAGILLRARKEDNKLNYDDFQTIMKTSESFKVKIDSYNGEEGRAILLSPENDEIFITEMDILDFKVGDEIYINLNIFPAKVEFRKNEDDYYNHLQDTNGGINIFNIGVGVVSPVIGMIKGERDKYPGITDEMLQYYRDDFMVASGVIKSFKREDIKMQVEENSGLDNNELPLGQVLNVEFETQKKHKVASTIEEIILNNFIKTDGALEINLDDNPIIKVYGYFSGYIDVNKSK